MKIFIGAELPEALAQSFLQHVRDFDTAHEGCHFEMMIDAPTLTLHEMIEAMRLNPELTFTQIFERK